MPDDTTEAREAFARELDRDGEEVGAMLWRESGPAHPNSANGRIVRAMLAYAATARQSAIEEAARVAEEGAVCGCGRSDCAIDGKALSIADAIRQLGSSGEEA